MITLDDIAHKRKKLRKSFPKGILRKNFILWSKKTCKNAKLV